MKIFKKKDDNIFELFENEIISEYSAKEKPKSVISPDVLTADELNQDFYSTDVSFTSSGSLNPLDSLKKRMKASSSTTSSIDDTKSEPEKPEMSLFERCKPYTTDDSGKNHSVSDKKLYKLESVAEILKSDSERAIEELSKNKEIISNIKLLSRG
jgi:hypothetical protein